MSKTVPVTARVTPTFAARLERLAVKMNEELPGAVPGGFGRVDAARLALAAGLKAEEERRGLPPIEEPAQEQDEE